jgi:hypothetical protein
MVQALSRKIEGSRPNKVTDFFFNLPNPCSHTVAFGVYSVSTLKWVSEDILGGKPRLVPKADNLTSICELIV